MPGTFNTSIDNLELITRIPVAESPFPIDYNSKIVSLGSCFAVNMAQKLEYFKFRNTINPFGILFHPLAIEKFVQFAIGQNPISDGDVFFHNERWHCFDAHSDLSNPDKGRLLDDLNSSISKTTAVLADASHIVITLGTAWAYRNNASGELVANCHKLPQKEFSKELLTIDAIADSLLQTFALMQSVNPMAAIILTVSPVRHIKDGFIENQRSKAHLIAAVHQVIDEQSSQQPPNTSRQLLTYFPSYEIMMDELRDYRFYAQDMLHPNELAIDYIWERFTSAWISKDAFVTMAEVDSVRKALSHRPFNPDSDSHRKFVENTAFKIAALQRQFPHIGF